VSRPSTSFALRKSALLAVALGFTALGALPASAITIPSAHAINALIPHSGSTATSNHPISISKLPTSVINQLTPANHPVKISIGQIGAKNICALIPSKCAPGPIPGPTPTPTPIPLPSGGKYPSGGTGGVVVVTPPVVVHDPGTVITTSRPVATAIVNPAAVVTQPCNCLTKQYLDDGSVLFNDICTKEAAMATPADLKAQKAAAVQ
jgi:hypothetical protein